MLKDIPKNADPETIKLIRALKEYQKVVDNDRIEISESEFVSHWLPLLHGDVVDSDGQVPIARWMDIAKGPFGEVSVVDGSGELLFVVPKVFNELATIENRTGHTSIQNMLLDVSQRKNKEPPEMTRRRTDIILNAKIAVKSMVEDNAAWNDIFTRYGYSPVIFHDLPNINEIKKDHRYQLDVEEEHEVSDVEEVFIDGDDW